MDEFNGADIDTASRLRADEQHRVALELPRDDHLLLISAAQRAHSGARRWRPNIVARDEHGGVATHAGAIEQPALRGRRAPMATEHQILGDAEVQHQSAPMPILRDVRQSS